jgi:hypothetical protein
MWKYGNCSGDAGDAVAGTSLLADQFIRSGYRVVTARTLGRAIQRAQVVVWFPDRFEPLNPATCQFFNEWLSADTGRTLIYVGRDFDVRTAYWRRLLRESVPGQELAIQQRLAQSQVSWARRLASLPATDSCLWFKIDRRQSPLDVQRLEGPLRDACSSLPHQLELRHRVQASAPDANVNVLLSADQQPLITEYQMSYWQQSRLLIVTNASPLVNLSMTLPAHQQLAQRLIDSCGTPGRCVFLISGVNDPVTAGQAELHHLVRILTTPPFSSLLMHVLIMGLVYCFAVYPMFGRPKSLGRHDESDFGRHVEALGQLLAKTTDSGFAQMQRQEYLQRVAGLVAPEEPVAGNPFRPSTDAEPPAPTAGQPNT